MPTLFISAVNLIFIVLFVRQITIVVIAYWTHKTGVAPFKSTEVSVIKTLISEYGIPNDKPIYDLGSGSGKALFTLAKYVGNPLVGIEKNLLLHWIAQLRRLLSFNSQQFTFIRQDIFEYDLKKVQNIYLYLSPMANKKLRLRFENNLPKNSYIFALRFAFTSPHFKLMTIISAKYPLYIYKKRS